MMNHKRILSFLLAMVLVMGMLPTRTSADEVTCGTCYQPESACTCTPSIPAVQSETEATETTAPTTTGAVYCPDCGDDLSDGHYAACPSFCTCTPENGNHDITCKVNPDYVEPCAICGTPGCEVEHKQCGICQTWDCDKTHVYCDTCAKYDCSVTHVWCETCQKNDCGVDHTLSVPCMICGTENCTTDHVKCEECDKYDCEEHTVTEPTETEEEKTFAESLLEIDNLSDLLIEICKEENQDAALTLTTEEITDLKARVEELYASIDEPTDQDEMDRDDLLATLAVLPNAPAETETVSDKEYSEAVEEIIQIMDEFVELVEALPETDEISAFNDAVQDFAEIHAMATKDTPLSDVEVAQYESAYLTFAEAMGYDSDSVEITYPDPVLQSELQASITEAQSMLEDAESQFVALPENEATVLSLKRDEDESVTSVVSIDESYSKAEEKLNAILEDHPELGTSNNVSTYATDLGNGISTVDTVAENIQMNLFNYGPLINTQASGQGLTPFVHSEGTYGWAVDSGGNEPGGSAGGWPVLQTTLTNERKFPYVTQDKGTIKKGSLQYLFDPAYTTGRISYETYKANISSIASSGASPYQYHSIYFPIDNNDGSGTGLFRKDGNYFVYDSGKNAAWYNPDTQKFELYDYVVRPAYTTFSTDGTNGNFLPFNQGHTQGREDYQEEKYTKKYTYTNAAGETVEATASVAKLDTVTTKPSGALTAYRLYGNTRHTEVDLWFGMNLEFDFNQPRGGIKGSEAMVFEFLGDDDVFVYIDDVLILDIGGTHGAQTGKINFATGAVTNPAAYGQYAESSTLYELMKAAKGSELDESQFIDANGDGKKDTFKDFTTHNLKFYYLERGGNISYCRLKFNLDPLPTGNVTLQKQVEGINEAIVDDQTYEFTVTATDANSNAVKGMTYQITSGDTTGSVETVSSGGKISLKANEIATFTNLTAGTTVIFTEDSNNKTSKLVWTLNGEVQNSNSATATVSEDSTQAARFVCTNTRITTSLTVEKKMAGDEYSTPDQYEINVSIGGKPYTGSATKTAADGTTNSTVKFDANGKVKLLADEKVTITGIPTGLAYAVSETTPENTGVYSYDVPAYKVDDKSVESVSGNINAETKVTVTNTLHLLFGNLTIHKNGISDLDHHDAYGSNKQETQSTIYTISGTSLSGESVNMKVVIVGNGSTTIKNLPVGTYTVTEDTDWSWRYEPKTNAHKVTIVGGETAETTFENERKEIYWLSGDSYCENWWNNDTVTRKDK